MAIEWQIDDQRPIYAQLMEQMEQAVVCGEFGPGEKLPSVRDLATQAGVNPNTMQRALAELETRGLLQSQRTSGRFVTQDQQMIWELRQKLAQQETRKYMQAMGALGCSRDEILEYLKQEEP